MIDVTNSKSVMGRVYITGSELGETVYTVDLHSGEAAVETQDEIDGRDYGSQASLEDALRAGMILHLNGIGLQ